MATAILSEASPITQELQEVSFDEAIEKVNEHFRNNTPVDFENTSSFRRVLKSLGFTVRPQQW